MKIQVHTHCSRWFDRQVPPSSSLFTRNTSNKFLVRIHRESDPRDCACRPHIFHVRCAPLGRHSNSFSTPGLVSLNYLTERFSTIAPRLLCAPELLTPTRFPSPSITPVDRFSRLPSPTQRHNQPPTYSPRTPPPPWHP